MELLVVIALFSPLWWLAVGDSFSPGAFATVVGKPFSVTATILAYFAALFVVWAAFSTWMNLRVRRRTGAAGATIRKSSPELLGLVARGLALAALAALLGRAFYDLAPAARPLWLPVWAVVFAGHLLAVAATPLLAPALSRPGTAAVERLGRVTQGLALPQDLLLTRRGRPPFFPFVKITRVGSGGTGAPARYWGVGPTRTIFLAERFLARPEPEVRAAIAMEAAKVRRSFNLNRIVRLHLLFLPGILLLAFAPALAPLAHDVSRLPLALALVSGIALLVLPIRQRQLRALIAEADDDALTMTRDPRAYALFVERYEGERENYPAPLRRWLSPKPSVVDRIRQARDWERRHITVKAGTWGAS